MSIKYVNRLNKRRKKHGLKHTKKLWCGFILPRRFWETESMMSTSRKAGINEKMLRVKLWSSAPPVSHKILHRLKCLTPHYKVPRRSVLLGSDKINTEQINLPVQAEEYVWLLAAEIKRKMEDDDNKCVETRTHTHTNHHIHISLL